MKIISVNGYIILEDLLYSENHLWAKVKNNVIVLGITDFLQKVLKTIIGVYFPNHIFVERGSPLAWLESIEAVVPILSPMNCELIETNTKLRNKPYIINADPYGEGWMVVVRLSNQDELKAFKDAKSYAVIISALSRCERYRGS